MEARNIAILDELRFTTGAKIIEHGALESSLLDTIETAYRVRQNRSADWYHGPMFVPPAKIDPHGHLVVVSAQTLQPGRPNLTSPQVSPPDNLEAILIQPHSEVSIPMDRVGGRTILVIEDEPALLMMYGEYLRKLGRRQKLIRLEI